LGLNGFLYGRFSLVYFMLPWFTANIFWPKLFFKNDEAKATGIQIFAETVPLRWLPSTIPVRISYRATYRRGRSSVTRNCNNLIRIQALTSQENESDECIQVTVESVTEKLREIDKSIRQVVRMVYRLGC
jgi:hypothetical protein